MRGVILGLKDRESALSGEPFVRGLPRARRVGVDRSVGVLVSLPKIESVKDDRETGM